MSIDPIADVMSESAAFLVAQGVESEVIEFITPPRREYGDLATNAAFKLAKVWRKTPRLIAEELVRGFDPANYALLSAAEAADGFINFRVRTDEFAQRTLDAIHHEGPDFGEPHPPSRDKVVVEHTSVNPTKPWHIGHARNAILGDTVARILVMAGCDIEVQNYVNDAGRQVGETIFALSYFDAPDPANDKYDHFLARYYVRMNSLLAWGMECEAWIKQEGNRTKAGQQGLDWLQEVANIQQGIEDVLRELERSTYRETIERCVRAQLETASRLGIFYNLLTWETDIIHAQLFEEAMERVRQSPQVKVPDEGYHKGCLIIEMGELLGRTSEDYTEEHSDKVVLIRSNGLPTYTGKDIAYQLWKFGLLERDMTYQQFCVQPDGRELWTSAPTGSPRPRSLPKRAINVIGAEQSYPQQVVYSALKILGFKQEYAGSHHLAYGLVELEGGRMSGRRGVWVSTDEVIEAVKEEAYAQVTERHPDLDEREAHQIAQAVAVGAIRFEMCRRDPSTDFVFRIKEVLDMQGFSSVYCQYAYVRCLAILRKAEEEGLLRAGFDPAALRSMMQGEQDLVYALAKLPQIVSRAAGELNPSLVAAYGYEVATNFNQFYTQHPVLNSDPLTRGVRLAMVRSVAIVLANVLNVLGIPLVEKL